MEPRTFSLSFWLPNHPRTHGEIVTCVGGIARVGEQLWEVIRFEPDYPDGMDGILLRLTLTFRQVDKADYLISFDELFRYANSPWPRRPEDRANQRVS